MSKACSGLKVQQEVMSVGLGNVVHNLPETCCSLSYSRAQKMQDKCVFLCQSHIYVHILSVLRVYQEVKERRVNG